MKNLDYWEKFSRPPLTALKQIGGGRLRGKTDINPQWRLQAMTEAFGPCGIGWKYTIDKLWTEQGTDGQVCAFALVSVYVRSEFHESGYSDPVPGIGGSMLIEKEKSGLYTSDEAYKMAVTDALSVAFKSLGVAAEIYLGNFDGSKYKETERNKEDIAELSAKYLADCDKKTTLDDLKKWWSDNSEKIKKDLGQAQAAIVYNHMIENKKILEAENATAD